MPALPKLAGRHTPLELRVSTGGKSSVHVESRPSSGKRDREVKAKKSLPRFRAPCGHWNGLETVRERIGDAVADHVLVFGSQEPAQAACIHYVLTRHVGNSLGED